MPGLAPAFAAPTPGPIAGSEATLSGELRVAPAQAAKAIAEMERPNSFETERWADISLLLRWGSER